MNDDKANGSAIAAIPEMLELLADAHDELLACAHHRAAVHGYGTDAYREIISGARNICKRIAATIDRIKGEDNDESN